MFFQFPKCRDSKTDRLFPLLADYPTRHIDMPRDADGNRDYLFVPGYYLLYYDYTQRNQLFHIKDGNNNPVWTYTYDPAGNVTNRFGQWGIPNGVNYGYDALNRIEQVEQGNATEVFARNHYQYDTVNREVATWRDGSQEQTGSKGERFWYATNNQVQQAWYKADNVWTATPSNPATYRSYTYTPDMLNWSSVNDNGYNVPFVANPLNQYTSVNGSTPQYDDRFNLHNFGGMIFEHDSANQLTSVTGNGHSASFTYDGLGRCVRRTVDGVTRLFIYDNWNPVIEFDQAGNWKAMNLYGAGADEILGRYDATLGNLIYKQDKQGNVTYVLDPSNQIVEKYTYDAYGTPTILSANNTQLSTSAIGNRFMYTGREWIGELGIYDYRHRYYLPSIGRFLQMDPTGFDAGDMNLFRYCGDDPVDRSDPTGLADGASVEIARRLAVFDTASSALGGLEQLEENRQKQLAQDMASHAEDSIGSTKYHNTGFFSTVNHCNLFPADMAEASGRVRPQVWVQGFPGGFWRTPVSHEYADPKVKIPHWTSPRPLSEARRNDIIAQQHGKWGHVGVVTGPGRSVTVNTDEGGVVRGGDWGFRPFPKNGEKAGDPPPVVRHYIAGSGGEW